MTPIRLRLDAASCTGHGICALRCPERVALDEWGFPDVDPEPLTARGELVRARLAVAACPERALWLEDPAASSPPGGPGGR
jgi:ferredoxin